MWPRLNLVLWFKETRKAPTQLYASTGLGKFTAFRRDREMRHTAARWFTVIAAMFALSFVAGSAFAQDDDPPNRAARISYASGSVSFEPAGTDEWVEAIVNRPMTTGDKLWADQDGRVEVRIDSYALRLGPQTGFSFLILCDHVVQVCFSNSPLTLPPR